MPFNVADIWKYELRRGATDHPANGACLFDAGMWLVYGKIGDNPPCSCPIIRAFAVALNDRMPDSRRQLLKPFILRVVGNRDPDSEGARLHFIILETVRKIISQTNPHPAFRALRELPDDAPIATITAAVRAAAETARSDYFADFAQFSTTEYAARCAATAEYAAGSAAITITRAARIPPTYRWTIAIEILDGALRIGKQSPEFDEQEVRRSALAFSDARLLTYS